MNDSVKLTMQSTRFLHNRKLKQIKTLKTESRNQRRVVLTTADILLILALKKTEVVPRKTEERIYTGLAKYLLQTNRHLNCQHIDKKKASSTAKSPSAMSNKLFCFHLELLSTLTCFTSLPG